MKMDQQQNFNLNNGTLQTSLDTRPALKMSSNAVDCYYIGLNDVNVNTTTVDDDDVNMTTATEAAAAAADNNNLLTAAAAAAAVVEETEMQNQWIMTPEEGRLGTPDAATTYNNNNNNNDNCQEISQHNDNLNNNQESPQSQQQQQQQISLNSECSLSSDELITKLKEYDALQDKYHTILLLPKESKREVTAGGRNGSAYVLRCLKVWYELPSEVLFTAISLVDRFLDRMTVKPKHLACMSVASFHLAIRQLGLNPIPPEDLVNISQCGGTAGDLERMTGVIADKIGVQIGQAPITSINFLRIFYNLFKNLSYNIGGNFYTFYVKFIQLEELEMRLEVLLCDVRTTAVSPSTLALVLICLHLDKHIKESYTKENQELKHLFEYILYLQQILKIPDRVFTCGFSIVSDILTHYNGQNKQPYKQRLVWKLSARTLKVLRPTNQLSSHLPTIKEDCSNPDRIYTRIRMLAKKKKGLVNFNNNSNNSNT